MEGMCLDHAWRLDLGLAEAWLTTWAISTSWLWEVAPGQEAVL